MRRKRTQFGESARLNNTSYAEYFNRLQELAMSMFEWKNLPDTVDERFLELTLFNHGQALFFEDDVLGHLALTCTASAPFNVYRIPLNRRAYASNGYNNSFNEKNSVLIYNNLLHTNTLPIVKMFAERLWGLDRIIDVNANAQKTPVLIQASEQQRLTMLNLYQQFDGNQPFIFGDKNLDVNGIKAISTDAPYVADKIYTLKTQYWNEALTYLGISNLNVQKKERMVADEVVRNMGGTIASRYSRLESRRKACDEINKMFGLNIEVDFREDYREADDEVMFAGETGDKHADTMAIDVRTK